MTVQIIETGETVRKNDGYALRLIEQGKAVLARDEGRKPATVKERAEKGDN